VSGTPAFTSIGQAYLEALAVRDFDRIEKLSKRWCPEHSHSPSRGQRGEASVGVRP
jgi:hypothetical protein